MSIDNCEPITGTANHFASAQTAIKSSTWFKKSGQGVASEAAFHLTRQLSAQEIQSPFTGSILNNIMRALQPCPPTFPRMHPLSASRCPTNIKGKENYSWAIPSDTNLSTPLLETKAQDSSRGAHKKYGLRR